MNITLSSTTKIVSLNGVPARIWEGKTDNGVNVIAFITRIAISKDEPIEIQQQFEQELIECQPPSVEALSFLAINLIV